MSYFHHAFLALGLLLASVMSASVSHATIATEITIERFVYDGQVSKDYDEYVKICNVSGVSTSLGGANPWRLGDEESASGGSEGMFDLQGTLNGGECFIIAANANAFNSVRGFLPDYEMRPSIGGWTDNASVPNLSGSGTWALNNDGDNITLWKYNPGTASYDRHDEVAYGSTSTEYTDVGLDGTSQISCPSGSPNCAVTRNNVNIDTDKMADDFNTSDNPTAITLSSLTIHGQQSGSRPARRLAVLLHHQWLALGLMVVGVFIVAFKKQQVV